MSPQTSHSLLSKLKSLTVGALVGAFSGALVLGAGGRLVMRIIAILGPVTPGASLGGTLEVVAFGALVGLATGMVYYFVYKALPHNPVLKGTIVGLLVYVTLLILPFDSKLAAQGFPDLAVVVHVLFAALCVVFGLILIPLSSRMINRFGKF